MKLRKPRILKTIAVFLAVNMLNAVFMPTVSYALTAGPTAPEYTSFEPVDTNSMVDLATGDLTYSIPLVNIPGPEGGYPLALAYHAGIQPGLEASWVGLGWTLNPGAINRSVNGFPDDFSGVDYTTNKNWPGRTIEHFGLGVSAKGLGVNFAHTSDSYRGVSKNLTLSSGKTSLSVSSYRGGKNTFAFKNSYLNISSEGGISPNYEALTPQPSLPLVLSTLEASLKTEGSTYFGLGSISHSNTRKGDLQTENNQFRFMTPWLNLNYQFSRVWIDEIDITNSYGIIQASDLTNTSGNKSLDSYAMFGHEGKLVDANGGNEIDINHFSLEQMFSGEDAPEKFVGGSLPSYDVYNVVGQGIGGTMQPFMRDNPSLFRKATDDLSFNTHRYATVEKADFRFLGDFSNSFKITDGGFKSHQYDFPEPEVSTSSLGYTYETPTEGFNQETMRLAGSKHIEYYTNQEINDAVNPASAIDVKATAGFVDYPQLYEDSGNKSVRLQNQNTDVAKQIGAYSITNSSGMTYHFALPVYTYENYQHYEKDEQGSVYSRTTDNPQPYAYTWLLTAVTGPDYVDANGNGFADEADFGYWVTMEYGKWTDCYQFRNPEIGFNIDVDGARTYTYGKKELYYLDKIKTRTHTGLFVKKIRADGKGVANKQNGGFVTTGESVSTLQLDKVYLIENDKLDNIISTDIAGNSNTYQHLLPQPFSSKIVHQGEEVIDIHDFHNIQAQIEANSLRTIELMTDYSLVPETPNSYHSIFDLELGNDPKGGKLTLKGIKTYGKAKADVVPPVVFEYDNISSTSQQIELFGDDKTKHHGGQFEVGDILKFELADKTYYAVVTEYFPSYQWMSVKYLGKNKPNVSSTYVNVTKTKNPPYQKDFYDVWGMYKVDFDDYTNGESHDRLVTNLSSKHVDAWSLCNIKTSIGAELEISYESDEYAESTMQTGYNYMVQSFIGQSDSQLGANEVKIYFYNSSDWIDKLTPNVSQIDLLAYFKEYVYNCDLKGIQDCQVGTCHRGNLDNGLDDDFTYVNNDRYFNQSVLFKQLASGSLITGNNSKGIIVESAQLRALVDRIADTPTAPNGQASLIPIAGNVRLGNQVLKGGGLRVKQTAVYNPTNGKRQVTNYSYELPNGTSSGVTPFEPNALSSFQMIEQYSPKNLECEEVSMEEAVPLVTRAKYMAKLYNDYNDIILFAQQMVAPGVLYGTVKVSSGTVDGTNYYQHPSSNVYKFQTFEQNMIEREVIRTAETNDIYGGGGHLLNLTHIDANERGRVIIHNRTAALGANLTVTQLDKYDNPITKISNLYTTDPSTFQDQGRHDELYHESRIFPGINNNYAKEISVITQRITYPAILTGTKVVDYRTGIKKRTENKAFDFYSGSVTEALTTDSYGNQFLSVSTPAYQIESNGERNYSEMGLKIHNPFNKNMLTQMAMTQTVKGNTLDQGKTTAISVQTWNNDWEYQDKPSVVEINSISQQISNLPYYTITHNELPVQLGVGQAVLLEKRDQNGIVQKSEYARITSATAYTNSFAIHATTPPDFTHIIVIPSPHRKHQAFTWNAPFLNEDGTFANFDPFNWDDITNQNQYWSKTGEITKYDVYSKGLEARDINGNYVATLMDHEGQYVQASAANANHAEFTHSGAEKVTPIGLFDGNATIKGTVESTQSHTGNHSVKSSNNSAFEMVIKKEDLSANTKHLKAFVWYKADAVSSASAYLSINSNGQLKTVQGDINSKEVNGWRLLEVDALVDGTTDITIKCGDPTGNIYFDDFRVQPFEASVTAYVYNDWDELSFMLANDNTYTKYEYDGAGRLTAIYQESFEYGVNKLSDQFYHNATND